MMAVTTADHGEEPLDADRSAGGPLARDTSAVASPARRTHHLLPDDEIRRRLVDRPAVAEWSIAVRAEVVAELGTVDTLSKLARRVKHGRRSCTATVDQLRRRYSEQLLATGGPPWKTAEDVLAFVVQPERQDDVRQQFVDLFTRARGAPPPGSPDGGAGDGEHEEQLVSPPAAGTGDLEARATRPQLVIEEQQSVIVRQRADLAAAKERNDSLCMQLAAQAGEAQRLRAHASALENAIISLWTAATVGDSERVLEAILAGPNPSLHLIYLLFASRSREAEVLAQRIAEDHDDRYQRDFAMVLRTVAALNLDKIEEANAAAAEGFVAIRTRPEPHLHGHLHAVTAIVAHRRGDWERAVEHVTQSQQAVSAIPTHDGNAAHCSQNLALAYSYIGFHRRAGTAIARARRLAAELNEADELYAAPVIPLRAAVSMDHQGNSEHCARMLRHLVTQYSELERHGRTSRLRPSSLASYAYASARLTAMNAAAGTNLDVLNIPRLQSRRAAELTTLAEVCTAIGTGRHDDALGKLDSLEFSSSSLGAAEIPRLRALATR
jgi:hypothetical protein